MAQEAPPQQPGPGPGIDIGGLVEGIVNGFREILTGWANDLPGQAATQSEPFIRQAWQQFWFSGVNVFGTPLELTWGFPAGQHLGRELFAIVPAIAALAVSLWCLRTAWGVITGNGNAVADAFGNVMFGIFVAMISTSLVGLAFLAVIEASAAIGNINYAPSIFSPGAFANFAFWIVAILVMLWYGWRLFVRGAYRIVLLMFLAPWAPLAGILFSIPQTRWAARLYFVNLGGWLVGGFLAVAALSMGVQLATIGNTNPMVSIVFGAALMTLAHDLMGWLPSAFSNSPGGFGNPNGGGPVSVPVVAAAGAAVATGGVATVAMPAVAGALPAGESPGLGY